MKIKAKFKGSNSLDYVKGENYWLDFTINTEDKIVIEPPLLNVKRCIYDSLKAFLNNWQVF